MSGTAFNLLDSICLGLLLDIRTHDSPLGLLSELLFRYSYCLHSPCLLQSTWKYGLNSAVLSSISLLFHMIPQFLRYYTTFVIYLWGLISVGLWVWFLSNIFLTSSLLLKSTAGYNRRNCRIPLVFLRIKTFSIRQASPSRPRCIHRLPSGFIDELESAVMSGITSCACKVSNYVVTIE